MMEGTKRWVAGDVGTLELVSVSVWKEVEGGDGGPGYGSIGSKGAKGEEGDPGGPGETGPKGAGGKTGVKGAKGLASFSTCDLIQYVRDHSRKPECPVHPTELVFALDQSRGVTEPEFVRMKEMMSSVVRGLRVREHSCPAGARVAVLAYDSHARHLIRFSDAYGKDRLLREIQALPYERSSAGREVGQAMSGGPSADPQTITTATLEFSALDIIPVVIAFTNVPSVRRSFAIEDTGTFQVIMVPSGADYTPALEGLQRCTFCYDICNPDASCDQARPPPVQAYVDAAFLVDSSRHVGRAEFEDIRGFLGALLDHFEVSPEPETSVTGDRVALLSYAPPGFLARSQGSPVRTEFNLTTYRSKRLMKRHVDESVQQLHGDAFLGHALQWALDNVFLKTPNLRRNKVIFVISAGETSHLDRETLRKESWRAKCQGYALFVFSLGPSWSDQELEDLASFPLDHHLIQLGRIHKPDHSYGVKFLKAFMSSVRRAINKYPPINIRAKCSRLGAPDPQQPPRQLQSKRYFCVPTAPKTVPPTEHKHLDD
ncbi:matrilin 3b-like protein [Camelus ferus]|nr:matrilin 3b-like protein [Camelus ferus]